MQHKDGGPLEKDKKLVKVAKCKNIEEVVQFLNKQQMNPFCPKDSSGQKAATTCKDSTPSRESSRETIQKPGKKRQYYRKKVLLAGEYLNPRTGTQGKMIVKDLSFYGVSFSTNRPNDFKYDDIIKISFELDTPKRPIIRRQIQVRYLNEHTVGGVIVNPPEWDYDLGAYLLP
ncbi:MAG: hypothetical protein ACOCZ2_00390 [Thermodesulfobacteriota bacterium]